MSKAFCGFQPPFLPKYINHSYLVENGLIGTQKAPFDISITETNVENLAICGRVSIITVRSSIAGKTEVGWDFG